ncbi:hypothetical protein J2W23_006256 [Variovorax boronicumulans]|nr:hypothetical protein [Variovorax boronicumulans]
MNWPPICHQPTSSLLIDDLERDEAPVGPSDRFADCLRVKLVVLVALYAGASEFDRHDGHFMPNGGENACPEMKASASFHSDQRGGS